MNRKRSALGSVIVLATLGTAHAESRSKLFPLSSSGLPKSMKGTPGELTRVLSRSLGAEATTVPIEDAAALMECSLVERSCLEAIAKSVGVKTILFGRIERDDGVVVVKLTTFDTTQGRETQRTIEISGDTAEAMGESLRDKLEVKPVEPLPTPRTIDLPLPPPPAPSGVTPATWGMVIGGGVTLGVGLGFLVSANSLRVKVATAPTETRTEIERLVAMETAGRTRMQIGAGLTALGGVVTTIGVIRMVVQKRQSPEESRLRVDVVPDAGGASVVFSMGWK